MAVVATAASTVIGAFDPLEEIADICEKHSVWMHVDGCFGSSILMSRKHRHKARGVERSVYLGVVATVLVQRSGFILATRPHQRVFQAVSNFEISVLAIEIDIKISPSTYPHALRTSSAVKKVRVILSCLPSN